MVTPDATTGIPTIMFGAFDRHNFGDLLFPHIASAMLRDKNLLFAGLVERDLRSFGGHHVSALGQLAAQCGQHSINIIHAGGELLTCSAWEAAVMLLPPAEAQQAIARFDGHADEALVWARGELGVSALAPYTVQRELFPQAAVIYNAVGGVELGHLDPAMRAEVLANLKAANDVSVRDKTTQAVLNAAGIAARLTPDPAVMVAELFGTQIRARADNSEVAGIRKAFPQGYIAVQFSAHFGDDETLTQIAAQLDQIAISTGYGVAFFRAGAAPWHDDLRCYQRVAARMRVSSVKIFTSLNLWDICALIAHGRVYCGSSLHGRIVAAALALPRLNLLHPSQVKLPAKQAAFAFAWEGAGLPATVQVHEIAEGIRHALATDREQLKHASSELAAHYRQGFGATSARLN